MKNKYNLDFDIKNKRLKKFSISLDVDYFICCSSFLQKEKGLKFLNDATNISTNRGTGGDFFYFWEKKNIEKSEILMNTHGVREGNLFLGYVNLNNKDHFFLLQGDEDVIWHEMPSLSFFKYITTFNHKVRSFNCNSGKICFFSDDFIFDKFKDKKKLYEFKVKKGKYSLYSMNIENDQFKKDFPHSNVVGNLLVKD